MDYQVRIGRETYSLDASRPDDKGVIRISYRDLVRALRVQPISRGRLIIELDGRLENVFVASAEGGLWVFHEGRTRFVRDASEAQRTKTSDPERVAGAVTPPTPASVVRVMVTEGEAVTKGRALVVVTAMKMEMTLSAPFAGTVTAVNTEEGAQVSPGEILVEIDEAVEGDEDECP